MGPARKQRAWVLRPTRPGPSAAPRPSPPGPRAPGASGSSGQGQGGSLAGRPPAGVGPVLDGAPPGPAPPNTPQAPLCAGLRLRPSPSCPRPHGWSGTGQTTSSRLPGLRVQGRAGEAPWGRGSGGGGGGLTTGRREAWPVPPRGQPLPPPIEGIPPSHGRSQLWQEQNACARLCLETEPGSAPSSPAEARGRPDAGCPRCGAGAGVGLAFTSLSGFGNRAEGG